ncbi:MAG: GNAT family N-acetyltransferase [Verrucomicrobia bacterium]|nr:GNAT family N-acetyltransferase [Verrucomicrobiota bacterium]MBV8481462.1 GNAT family N-acetyltransferase [Verrucomicrobiota bacterium]
MPNHLPIFPLRHPSHHRQRPGADHTPLESPIAEGASSPHSSSSSIPPCATPLDAHSPSHRIAIHIPSVCYLQDLFTHESARGKGVGKALINGVCEQAKNSGSTRVYWQTHETNRTARRLYDQVAKHTGFIVYRNH